MKHAKPRKERNPKGTLKQSTIPVAFLPKPKKGESLVKETRERANEAWTPHKDFTRRIPYIKDKPVDFGVLDKLVSTSTPNSKKTPTKRTPKSKKSITFENWEKEKERILQLPKETRRKEYFCKDFIPLNTIRTWSEQYKDVNIQPDSNIREQLFKGFHKNDMDLSCYISIVEGDITKLEVDCIVNAANSELIPGGGVDRCITSAAGKMLAEENKRHGGCDPGDAVISCGYKGRLKKLKP